MRRIVCIALAFCSSLAIYAQVDSSFHIYLLAGQSNMAGRGEMTISYRELQYDNIFMLSKSGEWVPARHPLHFDKPAIVGVGPGLSFAKAMADADAGGRPGVTKVRIGLVPCAIGGTSIQAWVPGGYDSATKTNPYDDALNRIRIAAKSGVFKGILWHQGESDAKPAAASHYIQDLKILVERLRTAIGVSDIPFVAAELGYFRSNYALINLELQKLSAAIPFAAFASSKDLTHKGDTTHFNSSSADLLGKRMAEKMIGLRQSGK